MFLIADLLFRRTTARTQRLHDEYRAQRAQESGASVTRTRTSRAASRSGRSPRARLREDAFSLLS